MNVTHGIDMRALWFGLRFGLTDTKVDALGKIPLKSNLKVTSTSLVASSVAKTIEGLWEASKNVRVVFLRGFFHVPIAEFAFYFSRKSPVQCACFIV